MLKKKKKKKEAAKISAQREFRLCSCMSAPCCLETPALGLSSGAGCVISKHFCLWKILPCSHSKLRCPHVLLHCNSPGGAGNLLEVLRALGGRRKALRMLDVGFLPIASFSSNSFFMCVLTYGSAPPCNGLAVKFRWRKKLALKTFIRLAHGYNLWQRSWISERKLHLVCHSLWPASA